MIGGIFMTGLIKFGTSKYFNDMLVMFQEQMMIMFAN